MFENAAVNTDLSLTAKQAEILAGLVEHDQVSYLLGRSRAGDVNDAVEWKVLGRVYVKVVLALTSK